MESGEITSDQIMASSQYNPSWSPERSRLNYYENAWTPAEDSNKEWIQVPQCFTCQSLILGGLQIIALKVVFEKRLKESTAVCFWSWVTVWGCMQCVPYLSFSIWRCSFPIMLWKGPTISMMNVSHPDGPPGGWVQTSQKLPVSTFSVTVHLSVCVFSLPLCSCRTC